VSTSNHTGKRSTRASPGSSSQGDLEHLRRAPWHAVEQLAMRGAHADEVVAAVLRRAEDDVRPRSGQRVDGLLEEVTREGGRVAVDGDGAGVPRGEQRLQGRVQPRAEVRAQLRYEREARRERGELRAGVRRRVRQRRLRVGERAHGGDLVEEEAAVENRGVSGEQGRTQTCLHLARPRRLGHDGDGDGADQMLQSSPHPRHGSGGASLSNSARNRW
jgi:hypothetical protein